MEPRTQIKFCGITNTADALAAVDAGANLLGFSCDENSPRYVTPKQFCAIRASLPSDIPCVGVFDRSTGAEWRAAGNAVINRFDFVQYYDDRVWTDVIGENWDMRRKIKAFNLSSRGRLLDIARYNGLAQSYLLNVHVRSLSDSDPDRYGWSLATDVHQFGRRLYLTGGLTPDNVGRAVATVFPYAVDVTVGIESEPGIKDKSKMRDFVHAVRGAC